MWIIRYSKGTRMKQINFINTLSAKEQYALRRWFYLSTLFISATVMAIVWIQINQIRHLYNIKSQRTPSTDPIEYEAIHTRKEKLEKEEVELKQKINSLAQLKSDSKNPLDQLNAIATACQASTGLQSLTITPQAIELSAHCSTTQEAIRIVKNLNQSPLFQAVKLNSIQPAAKEKEGNSANGFLVSVSGKIKKQI
jgi:Tfp pilus assembly protein PilN